MSDTQSAEVVVIGGGARGCSIALFLARAGVRVILVERRYLASMVSSANGAQVNVTAKEPDPYTLLSLESARMYPDFIASLEADIFLQQEGILFVTLDPAEMENLRRRVETRNRLPGLHLRLLDGREAREIMPALTPDVIGGYVSSADGIVDVLALLPAMGRAARRAGATLLCNTEVTGIDVSGGRVQGVITNRGTIATPVVVDAAGVYTPHIGRMVGLSIPVDPEHGHMVVSQPYPRLIPIPTDYVTQLPNGAFLIGTTNRVVGYDTRVRPGWLPPFLQRAIRILPRLEQVNALRIFAHLRPMPPDRLPIYDRVPEIEGFYIAVGHSGITLAPITGKIFADLIVHGQSDYDLGPYSLKRFAQASARGAGVPEGPATA
ncbi:MAG: FAD-binding oxidoreductase [Desulfobacterales bacterium]|nr:MAG: FAD-binding oxidoreductase [Desulfobacterales bacterium]